MAGTGSGWSLTGNSGTSADINLSGPPMMSLVFKVNNQLAGKIVSLLRNTSWVTGRFYPIQLDLIIRHMEAMHFIPTQKDLLIQQMVMVHFFQTQLQILILHMDQKRFFQHKPALKILLPDRKHFFQTQPDL